MVFYELNLQPWWEGGEAREVRLVRGSGLRFLPGVMEQRFPSLSGTRDGFFH